jgi:hypothetical protein
VGKGRAMDISRREKVNALNKVLLRMGKLYHKAKN